MPQTRGGERGVRAKEDANVESRCTAPFLKMEKKFAKKITIPEIDFFDFC
jgi:hypothetical protein